MTTQRASQFKLDTRTDNKDIKHYSNAYLFIGQDKYLKFRTSFNSIETVPWNGDDAVKELLPIIVVPGESEYMAGLRAEHKQRIMENVMNMILQMAQKKADDSK